MLRRLTMAMIPVMVLLLFVAGCKPAGQPPQGMVIATQADISTPGNASRIACQNNLKQLGLGCKMYAAEHNGRFPDTLQTLYPQYNSDQSNVRCPSPTQAPANSADTAAKSDYELVAGLTEKSPANTVLICERSTAHHMPAGRNVLYVDGHVEFIKGAE